MPAPQFPELDEEIERLARESVPTVEEYDPISWNAGFVAGYKARRAEIEWLKSFISAAGQSRNEILDDLPYKEDGE